MNQENKTPKSWKMAIVTWICLYPTLNLVLFLLKPYIEDLPQLVGTLLITIFVVPIMGILISQAQKIWKGWLSK